jgi:hypothetical protein
MVYKASDLQSDMRHVAVKLFAASQAHTRLRAEFFGRVCVTAAHRCSTVAAEQVLAPARAGPAICRAAVWRDRAEIDGIAEPSRT